MNTSSGPLLFINYLVILFLKMAINNRSINLLSASIEPQGRWDRIYAWTANTAKYIIILTEVIVLVAIGIRFFLDSQINDLDKSIAAQKTILDGRQKEDSEVRALSKTLDNLSILERDEKLISVFYQKILDLIPSNVTITSINVDMITGVSITGEVQGYQRLLEIENNIRDADFIYDESFSTTQQPGNVIQFTADFKIRNVHDGNTR
jgi:hypothetical protein